MVFKFHNRISIITNISVYGKRTLIFLSIFIFRFNEINSQEINYSDPYTEKIIFNPSYSGISNCSEINLSFNKSFIYDLYSLSYNRYFDKYKSGMGFFISELNQAKAAIVNFKTAVIFNYRIQLNYNNLINTALQISYSNQHINTSELIFSNQINPIYGTINPNTNEISFKSYQSIDFSFGISYFTNHIRTGLSVQHIDKFIIPEKNNFNKPNIKINFGKIFSVKKNNLKQVTTEIIYENQNNFQQLYVGVHLINNNFLTRFFIKQDIKYHTVSGIISVGTNIRKVRLSYTYSLNLNRYLSLPINSHQLSIKYNFNCSDKRKNKNTINCLNI
jgi:type IX secretion system PorP/SprF family membrane protein